MCVKCHPFTRVKYSFISSNYLMAIWYNLNLFWTVPNFLHIRRFIIRKDQGSNHDNIMSVIMNSYRNWCKIRFRHLVNRSQSISNAYLVFGQVWLLFFWCMVMMRLSWYCARGHLERQDRICWSNQSKQNFCNTADIKWLVGAMFWLHLSNFNKIQFFIP
jgi:hypothetical protein